jgi:exosome complex RNA-binding protein Csl4
MPGATPQTGDAMTQQSQSEIVRGKILAIQGEKYTIETSPETQAEIRIDTGSQAKNTFMVGDWIHARVSPDQHVLEAKKASPGYTVEGVLRVEGDSFVIQDDAGKEVRLKVDSSHQGHFKSGDRIRAEYGADGKATSVQPAKVPMSPSGG